MPTFVRRLVSKNKKRLQEDNFDLDLTYITDNVIAMGFPSEGVESIYRNPRDEVVDFLSTKHGNKYKVYNLCSERDYNDEIFEGRVARFPFDDHQSPLFDSVLEFCVDVHEFLKDGKNNAAVVHCKAGKGRTGVMICCYLLFSQTCKTALDSLHFYGDKRTKDAKGVTIPSQRRYCYYFEQYLRNQFALRGSVKLHRVTLREYTKSKYYITIKNLKREEVFSSKQDQNVTSSDDRVVIDLKEPIELTGDFKVVCVKNGVNVLKSNNLLHCWLNTRFITNLVKNTSPGNGMGVNAYHNSLDEKIPLVKAISLGLHAKAEEKIAPENDERLKNGKFVTVSLTKDELDGPHSDKNHKTFSEDFQVDLTFEICNTDKVEDDSYLLGLIPKEFLTDQSKRLSVGASTRRQSAVTRGLIIDSHDDDSVDIIDETATTPPSTSSSVVVSNEQQTQNESQQQQGTLFQ
ncbi:predicted protein [Naegleria gruberi]|uniref:Phosphatidylinositol 3,4,5-trisphosphate 3-phosphatase and dual-specificity protein phosphatase PTEN n=1 Tax=Naegleria gruberi TaxID=5762 RepID=D2VFH7_NAEGR|nr:uncharacterized protein NAEGRDRAFT_67631 [Naegleria gruberi]EFC44365.1 predicted protein [Naegleria gruberi]|eukprot:XP_002677109.1 predicted protein [Naegleria gruberi strain NEG-M]